METISTVVTIVSLVVAGAVVALNGIAPLTKNTKDDKVRDALVFIHDKVLMVILPFLAARLASAETPAAPVAEVK